MKKTWISRRRAGRRRRAPGVARTRGRRIVRWVALGLVAVFLAPALPIAAMRIVPPLGSALMLERWVEARGSERPFTLRYEWVPLGRIAPSLRNAVVVSEDQRFYEHGGFDWASMGDAFAEWRDGGRLRGASTITQQLAKNLFLWPGRSFVRKGLEAWLALWLEWLWPKTRILEVYLNVMELGDGVFGAEAASRHYFGTSASRLDRRRAALLAAALPSPRRSNVLRPSPTLRKRQRWILGQI